MIDIRRIGAPPIKYINEITQKIIHADFIRDLHFNVLFAVLKREI